MQPCCFCKAGFRLVLIAMFTCTAWAQVGIAGDIRLKITDSSGSLIEGAHVSVSCPSRASRTTQTGRLGVAILKDVAPGLYRISVSKPGFTRQQLNMEVRSAISIEKTVILAVQNTGFSVDVVATTPLSGSELDRDKVPAPLQTADAADIAQTGATNLGSFLNRRFTGVHINEIQGNPFQPDVNYRGYTASPLLGTPQGLSIYMDGVRLNQPFGDVVSWDLIPRIAIAETTLIPGSNPLFGLNTLGGAIAVDTKDGLTAPGTDLTLAGGSWGRKIAEIEHGGSNRKGFSWYGAANLFFEDGWRASSPSDVRQFFGKLGWARGSTSVHLAVSFANNALTGNGLQEQRFLARNYSSVYTKPDITANRSPFLNLSARHSPDSSLTLSGNAYYRFIRTRTLNGDVNQDSLDQAVYQPTAADIRALTAAGYSGFPFSGANAQNTPFPFWRCVAQVLQRDSPAENCNGLLNRTAVTQQNYGVSGQVTWSAHRQQLTAGTAFDRRTSTFGQLSQFGLSRPGPRSHTRSCFWRWLVWRKSQRRTL